LNIIKFQEIIDEDLKSIGITGISRSKITKVQDGDRFIVLYDSFPIAELIGTKPVYYLKGVYVANGKEPEYRVEKKGSYYVIKNDLKGVFDVFNMHLIEERGKYKVGNMEFTFRN